MPDKLFAMHLARTCGGIRLDRSGGLDLPSGIRIYTSAPKIIDRGWTSIIGTHLRDKISRCDCALYLDDDLINKNLFPEDIASKQVTQHYWNNLSLSSNIFVDMQPIMIDGSVDPTRYSVSTIAQGAKIPPYFTSFYEEIQQEAFFDADEINVNFFEFYNYVRARPSKRLIHVRRIFMEALCSIDPFFRLHQFCRCLESLIVASEARNKNDRREKTKKTFQKRLSKIFDPSEKIENYLENCYDIRGKIEHVHFDELLENAKRDYRLKIIEKSIFTQQLTRLLLRSIIKNKIYWDAFSDDAKQNEFWNNNHIIFSGLPESGLKRRSIIKQFKPTEISDSALGLSAY